MLFPGASFSIEGLACPPTSFCLWRVSVPPMFAKILLSMYRKLCLGLVALLASFLAGCSTPGSRIKSNPQIYASLSPADQALVRQGQIRVGMSKSAVFLAWGNPDRIRSGVRQGHPFEAWIYTTTRTIRFTGLLLRSRPLLSRRGLAASSPFLYFWSLFVSLRPISVRSC
jgi:hypothetical protein